MEVRAELEYPDHTRTVLPLGETGPGIFQTSLTASQAGIYRFRVLAEGGTYRGAAFTREQLLTAAVFHEIRPPQGHDGRGGDGGVEGASAFEKCCRRMGIFVWIIIILLVIIILLLLRS